MCKRRQRAEDAIHRGDTSGCVSQARDQKTQFTEGTHLDA